MKANENTEDAIQIEQLWIRFSSLDERLNKSLKKAEALKKDMDNIYKKLKENK